jgi:hypothetical protein
MKIQIIVFIDLDWLANSKVISVTTGCHAIIISIIDQRIFPIPWRTFYTIGAVKTNNRHIFTWVVHVIFNIILVHGYLHSWSTETNRLVVFEESSCLFLSSSI